MEGLRKYTIPIIGVLSSGKSTFLNGIFLNNSILEVGMKHTTKFICIIRHQNELPIGKYRFTKVKINSDYSLTKDGDTIKDEGAIKNEITKINEKEVVSEDILNNFYLLETNIHLIDEKKENDELLKDIDFMDIPGLDFFEAKKDNPNEMEAKKISNLFINFKDKLKYFIIIFDCLRIHHDSGLKILDKLKKGLNIKLENDLIVINKINLMPEKTVDEIKKYFFSELLKSPDTINHNKNIVLPINAEKIILQQQYQISFRAFIKYFYYLFCEYSLEKVLQSEEDKLLFLDYIIDFISAKKEELKIEDIDITKIDNDEQEIKPALEQIYTNIYHSEQTKNIKEEIQEEFFNDINKDNFLELYYLYSNNLIKFDKSEYNKAKEEIINYLKMIQKNEDNNEKNENTDANEKTNKNILFIKELNQFMESNILTQIEDVNNKDINANREFYKILKEMNQRKELIINAYMNTQFRISVVGLSSSGKSYFINCLIGKEILETGSGETTQFGLIIENHDSDDVSLFRARYKFIIDEKGKKYLIFEKNNESYVSGFEKVKNLLRTLNENKIQQEKEETQNNGYIFKFWILKIRIALCKFHDFNIQIIDFPGLGTSSQYAQTEIFKNLISTTNIIFHVLDFYKVGDADREISNIYGKLINDFRLEPYFTNKNTLFLLNKLNQAKDDSTNYEDKLSEIFGYKKEFIKYIIIKEKFFNDVINVTKTTFRSYLKNIYDIYQKRHKSKFPDFVKYFNYFNKIKNNEKKKINTGNKIIEDQAYAELINFLLIEDGKEDYEKVLCEYMKNNEIFKNNILFYYIDKKKI